MSPFVRFLLAVSGVLLVASIAAAQPKSLVIGIDGMGFGAYGFSAADTPNMDRLISGTWQAGYHGAYSDKAFAGGDPNQPETLQATSSGPGWSTFLTGVWVDQHNVPNNSFSNPNYADHPSYLETLEENVTGLHSASIINWSPIDTHIIATVNDGNSGMDFRSTPGNDSSVRTTTVNHIGSIDTLAPAAIFIHFDEVDGAGHGWGSGSPNYGSEISDTDGLVGDLLDAVSRRPSFADEDWQIIVTADHGHRSGGGHGGQSELERTIPFIVASKDLNQGNLPLGFPQPVSHADVAPTVLDHFGVSIPDHYYGVSRAAGAFHGNPDINRDGSVTGDGTGEFDNDDVVAFISLWLQPNTIEHPNPADLNLDGIANIGDWAILNASHPSMGGAIVAALHGSAVPEPSSVILLVLSGLALACWRRR